MDRFDDERSVPRVEKETDDGADDTGQDFRRMMPAAVCSLLSPLDLLIPSHKREAALRAIGAAFGAATVDSLERITKGASGAGVYKIIIDGTAYALRIEGSPDSLRDSARQYTCLRIAADAGVSPRLLYSNVENAIAVTDFIQTPSLHTHGSRENSLQAVVDMLKKLHGAPLFPESIGYLARVTVLMNQCQATEVLPKRTLERIRCLFREIVLIYPRTNLDVVSSHNDLHPGNLLFERERAWLVDWGAPAPLACAPVRLILWVNKVSRALQ
jgi:aminoglycoside phosphotransferase (APT) family kinase protein